MDVPSQTEASVPSNALAEDFQPPKRYVSVAAQPKDIARLNSHFCKRKMCPAIYIDLNHLKNELKIDLDQYLSQYSPWIGSHLSYSPILVRTFYCNLKRVDVVDDEGEVVEHRLESWVRGKHFEISAKKINKWLGIEQPPVDAFVDRNVGEILATLKPEGDPKGLDFKPSAMSEENRILWYIYTRAIVSKPNNFTSFARRDYGQFASLVGKDIRNLGSMIMNELLLWKDNALGTMYLPFPHIVSLFLKCNKIWYVEPSDDIVRVLKFGKTQMAKMGLTLATPHGEAQQKAKRKRVKAEQIDEVQSTRGATPEPPPSVQDIVSKVVEKAVDTMLTSDMHMLNRICEHLQGLYKFMDASYTAMMEMLRTQIEKTDDLSKRVKAFEILLQVPEASPEPSPSQPTPNPTSSHPIDIDPDPASHPFTHDIRPKLPSPPISSGHVSPSQIFQPSSPVPTTRSPENSPASALLQHTDLIIHQVLTDIGEESSKPSEAAASSPYKPSEAAASSPFKAPQPAASSPSNPAEAAASSPSKPPEAAASSPSNPPQPAALDAATHPDDVNNGQEGKSEGKAEE